MPPLFRFITLVFRASYALSLVGTFAGCGIFSGKDDGAFSEALREAIFESRAAALVSHMDDEAVAGQLLLTGVDGSSGLSAQSAELLERLGVGGVMLFRYNLGRGPAAARKLADECVAAVAAGGAEGRSLKAGSASTPRASEGGGGRYRILPFIAVDHEGGSVHRFASDATHLPAAADFGSLAEKSGAREAAETVRGAAYRSGLELRALGVTLNLAPVAETMDERNSPFLGDRSFGNDEELVAAAAAAFVEGMDEAGVACAVKHFPGNADADPHRAVSVISLDRAGLDRMASPFVKTISASRPAAVMVSHAVVASIDPDRPGSLSSSVVEDWLKGSLGFRGFVVTDDLRMGAITSGGRSPARAAVEAVAAGADLVMTWPQDLVAVRDALVASVGRGDLPRERLRDAARRIIAAKFRYGLCRLIDGEAGTGDETAVINEEAVSETVARFRGETERYLRERGLR